MSNSTTTTNRLPPEIGEYLTGRAKARAEEVWRALTKEAARLGDGRTFVAPLDLIAHRSDMSKWVCIRGIRDLQELQLVEVTRRIRTDRGYAANQYDLRIEDGW